MKKIFTAVSVLTINFLLLFLTTINGYSQQLDPTFDQDGLLFSVSADTAPSMKRYYDAIPLKDGRLLALFLDAIPNSAPTAFGYFVELLDEHGQPDSLFGKMRIEGSNHGDRVVWAVPQEYRFILKIGESIARFSLDKEIDASFGNNGVVSLCADNSCTISDIAVAPDNKIVISASKRDSRTLIRLNADGSPDQSFGSGGYLEISSSDNPSGNPLGHDNVRVAFLPDGKIMVISGQIGGSSPGPVPVTLFMRINTNGTIDRTYGTNGSLIIGRMNAPTLVVFPRDFVVQPDGSIIFGARISTNLFENSTPHVYRVLNNGVLDANVNLSLPQYNDVSLLQQNNGKIVVGGSFIITPLENWEMVLRRWNVDGKVDSSFGTNGTIRHDLTPKADVLRKLVLDRNRMYVVGYSLTTGGYTGVIFRYLVDSAATPPAVTITSPSTGTVFNAGTPLTIQTSVNPVSGSWSKIEFLNHGFLIGTDTETPYEFHTTGVEPGDYWIVARAISNSGDTVESLPVNIRITSCSGAGFIIANGYLNVPGGRIFDLTSHPSFPDDPDVAVTLNSFEFSNTQTDNFGARIRGYVCVPQTGWYTFHIAANSQGELWLSSGESPANKRQIASAYLSTAFRGWNSFSTQKSAPVYLVKGAKYYIEALHAEDGGDDHLSVAWTLPNGVFEAPIPGNRLIPFADDAENQLLVSNNFIPREKTAEKFQITASPNPSSSIFQLNVRSNSREAIYITVTDALGRVVERVNQKQPNISFAIGGRLRPGMYFVEVRQGSKRERISLMKR